MRRRILILATMALTAGGAHGQPRESRALARYHDDLKSCLAGAAAHASAQPEATRDTVADTAAKACEKRFVRRAVAGKLMEPAQARVEINTFAYQMAERVLSR